MTHEQYNKMVKDAGEKSRIEYDRIVEERKLLNPCLLYNQTIDLLWHLLDEQGVKEKYIKMAEGVGFSALAAEDLFSKTCKALEYYYHATFAKLPKSSGLVVE